MRTLKLHFPDDALPTLDNFLKQTKEARVFRRAQAVRDVVQGQSASKPSPTRCILRILRCASGSIASPPKVSRASWIAPAPVVRPK
jgi:hypothetical protein